MKSDKTWIQSHTGKRIDLLDPDPAAIDIVDIAHALSQLCRYTGHTKGHYSVAEHSIRVAQRAEALAIPRIQAAYRSVPKTRRALDAMDVEAAEIARWGLLHDATEAYLGDVSRPLKYLPGMEGYRQLEARWMETIAEVFQLVGTQPPEVSQADNELLGTEARLLMAPVHPDWAKAFPNGLPGPIDAPGIGWDAKTAETRFLMRFRILFPEWSR